MKKPGASSTGKSGLGSMGKGGLGSSGKSGLGSIGKSGISSTKNVSSSKSGGLLGSSGKTGSGLSSTSKSGLSLTSKSGLSSTSKSGLSPTSKSGLSPTSKTSSSLSPKPSKAFDFIPSEKPTSLAPTSSSYNAYGNSKSGKSSTTFGIIWIPTKKRNKNKDIVLSSQHEDRRRERSPSFYKFMSGDSPNQPYKKKEEEDMLVLPDRKLPIGNLAAPEMTPGNVAAPEMTPENTATSSTDDKQKLIRQDTEESKEAAGDTLEKDEDSDDDKDYLNNDGTVRKNLPDTLTEKDTFGDKVDSVYLRPPPPHKARSNTANTEEESCGMKCLYYTLQCCDCVLM